MPPSADRAPPPPRRRRAAEPAGHGQLRLPAVTIDAYNEELRHGEGGFLGDRASSRAFSAILEDWRARMRNGHDGADPLGEAPTEEIRRRSLDAALIEGEPEAAGLVQSAVEDFARELAAVIRRFLRLKAWQGTERLVIGGGFRESRIGEVAIGRTAVLLKTEGIAIDLVPIRHHPDEAGLLGAAQLLPRDALAAADAFLAVDIGGTNFRAGLVEPRLGKAPDLSAARVRRAERWRHRDEAEPPGREAAVERLVGMLRELIRRARKEEVRLAPWIGIGCPGLIGQDGRIGRGAQNLPGDWAAEGFDLPERLEAALSEGDGGDGAAPFRVALHNDAVVQGLSEVPFQRDVLRWGVLTIGTGLGNARFTNRPARRKQPAPSGGGGTTAPRARGGRRADAAATASSSQG